MQIEFTKQELSFLKDYVKVADKDQGKYLTMILDKEGGKIVFQVLTPEVDMITTLKKDFEGEEAVYNYFLKDFMSFVSLCDDTFTFTGDQFIVDGGVYTINTYNDKVDFEIAEIEGLTHETVKLSNLDKISTINGFIGETGSVDHTDAILYKNGNYIATTDRSGGFYSGNSNSEVEIYLTPKIVSILESLDSETANISVYGDSGLIAIPKDTSLFIFKMNKKFDVPDVFSSEYKPYWDHSYKATFNSNTLKTVLERLIVLADVEPDNILTRYTFSEGSITIETFDNKAKQSFSAVVPQELVGEVISLPVNYTQKVLKSFDRWEKTIGSSEISMYLNPQDADGNKVAVVTFKNDNMPEFVTVVTRLAKDEY